MVNKNRDTKFFIIYVFAGHGVLEGMQSLLTNEFDPKNKFYKLWPAEALIRIVAKNSAANSYHLAVFAACREFPKPAGDYNFKPKEEV